MQPINGVLKRKHYEMLSPGAVASVGDVLTQIRLKHSAPDLPIRWGFAGSQLPIMGSNVSDGQHVSYENGGGPATLMDTNWNVKRKKHINHGWKFDELLAPDMVVTPFDKSTPDYSWINKIATVNHAFDSGRKFAPLPGGYTGNGLPRGGSVPRITAVDAPEEVQMNQIPQFTGSIVGSGREYSGRTLNGETVVDPFHLYYEAAQSGDNIKSKPFVGKSGSRRSSHYMSVDSGRHSEVYDSNMSL